MIMKSISGFGFPKRMSDTDSVACGGGSVCTPPPPSWSNNRKYHRRRIPERALILSQFVSSGGNLMAGNYF